MFELDLIVLRKIIVKIFRKTLKYLKKYNIMFHFYVEKTLKLHKICLLIIYSYV